ncbi:DNA-binding protein [Limnohabitans sp.]|uniref:DNA-binding protein n=1 Tax=Limnohabitans sp. TaxID=1907725 RepID=UPI0025B93563|nr:DNA-binding protein [Limnohabitans sp.]
MFTVIETPTFQKQAEKFWTASERHAFIDWIASTPNAGTVIPGADGARKVRWMLKGKGKRGGVRVIYFNLNAEELVLLVAIYAKADRENLPSHEIDRS